LGGRNRIERAGERVYEFRYEGEKKGVEGKGYDKGKGGRGEEEVR